jgi:phosphohistidine phosphatase SixA
MTESMHKEYAKLRRQPFLVPLGLPVAGGLALLALLAWAVLSASTTTVFVVRHAELASLDGGDSPLSLAGQLRAERLRDAFSRSPAGLSLDGIVVTAARGAPETARPLANALGIPVVAMPDEDPSAVARRTLAEFRGGRALVIGDAGTVAAVVEALSGQAVPLPATTDFGTVYVVARPRYSPASVSLLQLP